MSTTEGADVEGAGEAAGETTVENPRATMRKSKARQTFADARQVAEEEEEEEEEEEAELLAVKEKPYPEWWPPLNTPTFAIPQLPDLVRTFNLYKPTPETCRKLKSEVGRTVFAEAFIEDMQLGTLADLCVRALAKAYGDATLPAFIREDPAKMRIHYDSLDVELPLEHCYHIESPIYWRRVVLAKDDNTALVLKAENDYDWRNHGISLKFVELVESCPAEHWPEDEMQDISMKIKPYVTSMKITKLKALQEYSFEKYFESSDEDEADVSDIWNISTSTISPLSASIASEPSIEEVEEEEEDVEEEEDEESVDSAILIERAERKAEEAVHKAAIKEGKRRMHQAKKDRIKKRKEKLEKQALSGRGTMATVKAKAKEKKIKGVFDIPISDDEEELKEFFDLDKVDHRDIEKALRRRKRFHYDPEYCHHIDLKFVRFFDDLESFHLEFQAPADGNFHTKHFNCSYDDIENLAYGLGFLYNLKTFRLRNSRLDQRKIEMLVPVLRALPQLETIDFGYDNLNDACGLALYKLFRQSNQERLFLELEGNFLGTNVLTKLADGIRYYRGNLEYLGLARNPIDKEGLEILAQVLIKTGMVSNLCLTGIQISQEGVVDVIANLLLREHTNLRNMSLAGIPLTFESGVRLVKALETNMKVLEMDIRGCGLDLDMEADIESLLKRNNYIVENPYIGDDTKTEEEVMEYVNRIKNPILLHVLEKIEKRRECERNRPTEFVKDEKDEMPKISVVMPDDHESLTSLEKLIIRLQKEAERINRSYHEVEEVESEESVHSETIEKFEFDPNNFTKEEFLQHVHVPGPSPRYFYFQELRNIGDIDDVLSDYVDRTSLQKSLN